MVQLASTSDDSRKQAKDTLEDVIGANPVEVVVWFRTDDGETHVQTSVGPDRTKTVGALIGSAMDLWNS